VKPATLSDHQLLDYSGEHLLYELRMFWRLTGIVPRMDGLMLSALLESYLIHLRNLIDFFYRPKDHEDDVIAADFFDDPSAWSATISTSLDAAQKRANKELSHLTTKRKSATDPSKRWEVVALFKEIEAVALRFAKAASHKKLHKDVRELLNAPQDKLMLVLGAGSNTTNSATSIFTVSSSGKIPFGP
jgi:hypothetical protein